MRRAMVDFVLDDEGDWIARLTCGHSQHVRHRPPFQERSWVLDAEGRRARLGTYLSCPLCDRAELPKGLRPLRRSPAWDNETAPSAIKMFHHLAEGTWGVITVEDGQMKYLTNGEVVLNKFVDKKSPQAIPPGLDHCVEFTGPVHFTIDYLSVERDDSRDPVDASTLHFARESLASVGPEVGGESACFANVVCTVCGAVFESDPHVHRN